MPNRTLRSTKISARAAYARNAVEEKNKKRGRGRPRLNPALQTAPLSKATKRGKTILKNRGRSSGGVAVKVENNSSEADCSSEGEEQDSEDEDAEEQNSNEDSHNEVESDENSTDEEENSASNEDSQSEILNNIAIKSESGSVSIKSTGDEEDENEIRYSLPSIKQENLSESSKKQKMFKKSPPKSSSTSERKIRGSNQMSSSTPKSFKLDFKNKKISSKGNQSDQDEENTVSYKEKKESKRCDNSSFSRNRSLNDSKKSRLSKQILREIIKKYENLKRKYKQEEDDLSDESGNGSSSKKRIKTESVESTGEERWNGKFKFSARYKSFSSNLATGKLSRKISLVKQQSSFSAPKNSPSCGNIAAEEVFRWLLSPLEPEEFFLNIFEKKPHHINRQKYSYYKELFNCNNLNTMLKENDLIHGVHIDVLKYENGERKPAESFGKAYNSNVWEDFKQGNSVRIRNPQAFNKNIWNICSLLQEYFSSAVGCNVYLTPPDSQGFPPHYDDIDAFIVQVEGAKMWKVYPPRNPNEDLARYSSTDFQQNEIGQPMLEIFLEPGDMLYVPRGYIHQAFTGALEHSLHLTFSTNQLNTWGDLMLQSAINNVIPDESPFEREVEIPMEFVEGANSLSREGNSINSSSVASSSILSMPTPEEMQLASRLLNFSVQYRENLVPLEVPDSETVAAIKAALHTELGVPPCRQELSGWRHMRGFNDHITDETVLSSLHLPQRSNLFLVAPDHLNSIDSTNLSNRLNADYKLHIIDTTNNKEYDLHFPGSKTVLDIKLGLRDVTNIPVRHQRWVGWPDSVKDENTKLADMDIPNSTLELILSREEPPKTKKQLVVDLTSSESENEFEDAAECFGVEDDMFQASSSRKILPLMPEEVEDELVAINNFEKEFENRYGTCHPCFQGTLIEALQASCYKPAKERRPLAIYLHHDASVLTNVFCTQLLCTETVVSYLTLNFVTWAWDLSFESNKTFLLAVLSQHLGMTAANTVKNLALDSLPALMIISKVRSSPEVLTVIPGNVGLDDLMTRLIHAIEVFNSEVQSDIWEEEAREARENVKREQDAAYEASLIADRAKEEARRQEFQEKMKQEEEEQMKKEELELMRQHEEAIKDAVRKSLAEQLPPEPPADTSSKVSHIRVRLPNGVTISRSFTADTPLSLLLTYIASQGYPPEEYKVLASWPRRDLTSLDEKETLEALKLYPKETLTLEER